MKFFIVNPYQLSLSSPSTDMLRWVYLRFRVREHSKWKVFFIASKNHIVSKFQILLVKTVKQFYTFSTISYARCLLQRQTCEVHAYRTWYDDEWNSLKLNSIENNIVFRIWDILFKTKCWKMGTRAYLSTYTLGVNSNNTSLGLPYKPTVLHKYK